MVFGRSSSLAVEVSATPGPGQRIFQRLRFEILPSTFAIVFGITLTLCVRGYQFGESNHNVYLIDALRHAWGGKLLARDWFTTQTFQYHAVFGFLTRQLYRLGIVEPAFLLGQLLLIFFMHVAWFKLVLRLGGTRMTYLISVLMFYVLAGGLGLGVYEFMQDQAFLPSNIANVAMLWGLYFWIARKPAWSGLWLGVAGLFHLNHALIAIGLWTALNLWRMWDNRRMGDPSTSRWGRIWSGVRRDQFRFYLIGSILVLGISIGNVLIALMAVLSQRSGLPFDQYVALYVKLRHAHHYYPLSWPLALWICFLLPIPLAIWAGWRRLHEEGQTNSDVTSQEAEHYACRQAVHIFALFGFLQILALLGAGFWYVSQPLVELSLYRFSIYVKLFSCIGAAWLLYNAGIWDRRIVRVGLIALPLLLGGTFIVVLLNSNSNSAAVDWLAAFIWRHRGVAGLVVILCALLAVYELIYARPWKHWRHDLLHAGGIVAMATVVFFAWGRWLQVVTLPEDEAVYLQMCKWVAGNTPTDALFLVPPAEQSFRLHAQRAIIVNFKGVPQLSGELVQWRDRLRDVLDTQHLEQLRGGDFFETLNNVDQRYRQLSPAYLLSVARKYGADYLITERPMDESLCGPPVYEIASNDAAYYLYHVSR
ncbi:MAG: hypothetical protein IT448_00775 [Phycisphaerales bacterium]|nr:hypothetical protein [Phycisphaerales bacterium]